MNKLAFKERMKSLKSYREQNPDKGYWEWKQEVPTMQYAGEVLDEGNTNKNYYITQGNQFDVPGYDEYGNMQIVANRDGESINFNVPEVTVTANKYTPKADAQIAYEADQNAVLGTNVLSAAEELARWTDYGDVVEHADNVKLALQGQYQEAALREAENVVYKKIADAIPFVGVKAVKWAGDAMLNAAKKVPIFYRRLAADIIKQPKETAKAFINNTYPNSYKNIKNYLQKIHELDEITKQQQLSAIVEDAKVRKELNNSREPYEQMPFYGDIAYANKRAKKTGVNSNVSFQGRSYRKFNDPNKSMGVSLVNSPRASGRVRLRKDKSSNLLYTPENLIETAIHERQHVFNRMFPEIKELTALSKEEDYYTVAGRNEYVQDFISDQFSFLNKNVGLNTHQSSPDEFLADLMALRVLKGGGKSFDTLPIGIQEDIVERMTRDYMFSTKESAKDQMRTVLFNLSAEGYADGGRVQSYKD